jgi:hypothetical protein
MSTETTPLDLDALRAEVIALRARVAALETENANLRASPRVAAALEEEEDRVDVAVLAIDADPRREAIIDRLKELADGNPRRFGEWDVDQVLVYLELDGAANSPLIATNPRAARVLARLTATP